MDTPDVSSVAAHGPSDSADVNPILRDGLPYHEVQYLLLEWGQIGPFLVIGVGGARDRGGRGDAR